MTCEEYIVKDYEKLKKENKELLKIVNEKEHIKILDNKPIYFIKGGCYISENIVDEINMIVKTRNYKKLKNDYEITVEYGGNYNYLISIRDKVFGVSIFNASQSGYCIEKIDHFDIDNYFFSNEEALEKMWINLEQKISDFYKDQEDEEEE